MSNDRIIGRAQLAREGWARVDGGSGKCSAEYRHTSGWRLQHCGHPTANHPYLLIDPKGRAVLTGAKISGRADYGRAWDCLRYAVDFLREHLAGRAPFTGPYRSDASTQASARLTTAPRGHKRGASNAG